MRHFPGPLPCREGTDVFSLSCPRLYISWGKWWNWSQRPEPELGYAGRLEKPKAACPYIVK